MDDDADKAAEVGRAALRLIEGKPSRRRRDTAADTAKRVQILNLRAAGLTYGQIAKEAGYADETHARKAVTRALEHAEQEAAADLRIVENARLDNSLRSLVPIAWAPHDEQAPTVTERISAVMGVIRISERRARLNGLDAPVKVAMSPATAEVQAWIASLLAASTEAQVGVVEPEVIDVDVVEDEPPPPMDPPLPP